jgi:hypothetical protein
MKGGQVANQTIKLSPETTDPPASSVFTAPGVVDDVEAYIPIKREPEFDVEAFRENVEAKRDKAKIAEEAAEDAHQMDEARVWTGKVDALHEVLALLLLVHSPLAPKRRSSGLY